MCLRFRIIWMWRYNVYLIFILGSIQVLSATVNLSNMSEKWLKQYHTYPEYSYTSNIRTLRKCSKFQNLGQRYHLPRLQSPVCPPASAVRIGAARGHSLKFQNHVRIKRKSRSEARNLGHRS